MPFIGLTNGAGPIAHGTYAEVQADDDAGTKAITTGLTAIETALVQITRSGVVVGADAAISYSAGVLTVADGSTYKLTAADVVNWIAIGT